MLGTVALGHVYTYNLLCVAPAPPSPQESGVHSPLFPFSNEPHLQESGAPVRVSPISTGRLARPRRGVSCGSPLPRIHRCGRHRRLCGNCGSGSTSWCIHSDSHSPSPSPIHRRQVLPGHATVCGLGSSNATGGVWYGGLVVQIRKGVWSDHTVYIEIVLIRQFPHLTVSLMRFQPRGRTRYQAQI